MKIVFFGTPDFAVPTLNRLLAETGFQVLGVVTQPDKRRGRGNQLIPSPIKAVALNHNLPVWQPKRIKKHPETLEQLQSLNADIFVVVAYGQILSQQILDMPRWGCINVHGSILPYYRGAAPIQWCLYNGEPETGITTMLMDAGMDTGAMFLKAVTPISLLENAQDVADRLANLGADLLVETIHQWVAKQIQPIPQENEKATYAPLIQKEDYQLNWSKAAIALHHQIRGFYPNCTSLFRQQPIKIMATVPLGVSDGTELPSDLKNLPQIWDTIRNQLPDATQPGEVVGLAKNLGPIIQTGDGLLLLRQIQLAGKRPQWGWDFVNGMRLIVGEKFE